MNKEKLPNRQVLNSWCKDLDSAHKLGLRASLITLVFIKCLSLFSLLIGFYFFAAIAHSWVVTGTSASLQVLILLALSLGSAWMLQGMFNHVFLQRKFVLLGMLEQLLLSTLLKRQHAIVRTQSPYFWQVLWHNQLEAFTDWAMEYRVQQWVALIVPIMALGVIFAVNPIIGLGLLLTLPVVPLFMIIVGKGAAALHRKHFVALERLGSLFTDRLSALSMLSSFNANHKQTELLTNASDNLNSRTMKVVSVAFLSTSVLDFFATLAVALVAVFIGFTLLGELQIGPSISLHQGLWILLVVPLLLSEMKKLGQVYHQKAQAEAACNDLSPLFHVQSRSDNNAVKNTSFNGFEAHDMRIFDSCYSTLPNESKKEGKSLLTCPKLVLEAGDKILLNGRSGSGKTILLEALSGQRPATHTLKTQAAWLTQHPVILAGTVRENLCLDEHFDDSQLCNVLEQVELTTWLHTLPNGLDTPMTEYPSMSGGEAQRLALARILLRNHQVWLLDEPTAHLPDVQHHRLASLIYELGKERTLVWASHKMLPVNWFTGCWRVENGVVAEHVDSQVERAMPVSNEEDCHA